MAQKNYDVLIIGAGPAGIQAAIHAARRKTSVLILGRPDHSAMHRAHIENYAFVSGPVLGSDLLSIGLQQAKHFGAETLTEDVLKIQREGDGFRLEMESGRDVCGRSLIFCMGVSKKKLGVPGEEEFLGRGLSYCVDCDANFYRNAVVAITGNQSAAVDGALTLLDYAQKVYLISPQELQVSQELQKRLEESAVQRIDASIKEISGEESVDVLFLSNGDALPVNGLFVELGAKGALELATLIEVQLDSEWFKYIAVNRKQETNIVGVYAAGDITGQPYQIAKAVGEGCIAGLEAASYVRHMRNSAQAEPKQQQGTSS